ncbi:Holliday junction branch migration protein RuvA [Acidaminococcus fermentans DSM 20731]|uniref:Holliday junction branch migration complex subunit RuvA n=1 Tax=Acidaminococcus fermentans (strain ATCC 25085 / DSM 20731 / CCUG 9996 / CIP 106432 / VR4) TaxID=591001 RepID=D2RLD5_ACIFV|nr:Holliday junction branch migration protein RuvA [Acidaminococcus fermentans]ADB47887.1 Holliday junction DNA helicase RuvA [Acidaminococcus fermentans DSM 20731]UEA71497.1 Holliday junction branch migration protein RuvA [Acidaminococcus fermentans DSM 20731]
MIGFITGRVDHIGTNFCLVDTQGVGYRIFLNTGDLSRIQVDQKVKIYTYLSVREDALQLFGFLSYDAYSLFTQLITVSGIGPKVAQGILSAAKVDAFYLAVKSRDLKFLTKLPGIGKKTAERLLLELKDMTGPEGLEEEGTAGGFDGDVPEDDTTTLGAVAEGLSYLGYTQGEIAQVLKKLKVTADSRAEDLLKEALRLLARRS